MRSTGKNLVLVILFYITVESEISCNALEDIDWVMITTRSTNDKVAPRSNNDNYISYSDYSDDDSIEPKIVTLPSNHKSSVQEKWQNHKLEQFQPTKLQKYTPVENENVDNSFKFQSVTAKPTISYYKQVTSDPAVPAEYVAEITPPTYYNQHETFPDLKKPIILYKNNEQMENSAKQPDSHNKNTSAVQKVPSLPDLMPPQLMERLVTVRASVMDMMYKIRFVWDYIWNFFAPESRTGVEESRSGHRKKVRVKKQYKKFMLPLLIAYKLKFFTLVPVLISGMVLLVGATGMAGFFFALFAAVISLKHSKH